MDCPKTERPVLIPCASFLLSSGVAWEDTPFMTDMTSGRSGVDPGVPARLVPSLDFPHVLHHCSTMKTATVRELRNNYAGLLELVKAGQEILITQRGEAVARLVPETAAVPRTVDWSTSEAVARDRSGERTLTAEESSQLLREASGKW